MQLTETLVAVAVFAVPLTATVQLASQKQVNDQGQLSSQQLARAVESDRLALQAAWLQLAPTASCRMPAELQSAAQAVPVSSGLRREVRILDDQGQEVLPGKAVWIKWSSISDGTLLRQRLYTPMGLGLCS
ncbi:MAG: hypothetical protein EBR33_05620 [Synechococcaceae bacterium WB4_1_0192]|jgi:hypothetical protein|nr:hypothetical protein [Synechococcaceae bacterium WB4_1_0192]